MSTGSDSRDAKIKPNSLGQDPVNI